MKLGSVLVSVLLFSAALISCKEKPVDKGFEINGTVSGSPAKWIYLEEVPAATMQRILIDSAELGKDGKFSLVTEAKEASVYNLRLEQQDYPFAAVINDAPEITVNIKYDKDKPVVGQTYEVKNSEASQQMKAFMLRFNNGVQKLAIINRRADSLAASAAPDSVMQPVKQEQKQLSAQLNEEFRRDIAGSKNPALSMFILGYYQTTANNQALGLQPLDIQDVQKIVDETSVKFPEHSGVSLIKAAIAMQLQGQDEKSSLVGKTAPEIVLPDMNGKEVRLSHYKGKYVLVDFWASWCKPCRYENPHVVSAYLKFREKNFDVLGVSLDKNKDEWLQAIKEDQLTWTHVSDLQFWSSPVVPLYGIEGIPFNVLVDPEGKIVAQGLRGAGLEAKLETLLK